MDIQNKELLIFDLGGVIIDIDPQGTFRRFAQFAHQSSHPVWQQGLNFKLFHDFETGKLGIPSFFDEMKTIPGLAGLSNQELEALWNTMLINIPLQRLALLDQLRKRFRLVILSNTNEIHRMAFDQILWEKTGKHGFGHWFDELYYSYELGMRKPDAEIYQHVLNHEQVSPEAVLFFDDNAENLKNAETCGIEGVLIHPSQSIIDFFNLHYSLEREA